VFGQNLITRAGRRAVAIAISPVACRDQGQGKSFAGPFRTRHDGAGHLRRPVLLIWGRRTASAIDGAGGAQADRACSCYLRAVRALGAEDDGFNKLTVDFLGS
jgi:hypothetical protein